MIDIVRFQGEKFNLGFKEIIYFKDLKIVIGGSENLNRKAVEDKSVDILMRPETESEKDKVHYRVSGLNQVLCKLANKNKVAIGFSFSDLLNSKYKDKVIGRMMQNVRLCRKYNVKMVICSFAKEKFEMRAAKDLISFGLTIGMTGKEANDALSFKRKDKEIELIK
ncbi:MAG: RNase P subunit p30 family protein [Candidatus Nanoarchaeia archaeon]|nr:RNase P subunit p30 family protein [Candidatus Nanoarchaeia archaeon]